MTEHHVIYDEPGSVPFPGAKRGGTYLYCMIPVPRDVPKLDSLGRRTRYTVKQWFQCSKRFRRAKKYRQHVRRMHAQFLTESEQVG